MVVEEELEGLIVVALQQVVLVQQVKVMLEVQMEVN